MGERSSSNPSPERASPLTWNWCSLPSHDLTVSTPFSYASFSSALSSDIVAYVIRNRFSAISHLRP